MTFESIAETVTIPLAGVNMTSHEAKPGVRSSPGTKVGGSLRDRKMLAEMDNGGQENEGRPRGPPGTRKPRF